MFMQLKTLGYIKERSRSWLKKFFLKITADLKHETRPLHSQYSAKTTNFP